MNSTRKKENPIEVKYVVVPGRVFSARDGDEHEISFSRLCQLYGVRPEECVDWSRPQSRLGWSEERLNGMKWLHVSRTGNYSLK